MSDLPMYIYVETADGVKRIDKPFISHEKARRYIDRNKAMFRAFEPERIYTKRPYSSWVITYAIARLST